MRITIDVPDEMWARAVTEFEEAGTTTRDEIQKLILTAATAKQRRVDAVEAAQRSPSGRQLTIWARRDKVIGLVLAGLTDRQICVETGVPRGTISNLRRGAGLLPNKPKKRIEGGL